MLDTYEPLFTWLMSVAYETSFTMRGATGVFLQLHRPNTAPATQNDCDDWSASHMKRHLQCAEQQESQSNFTKYCACHAKWISWLIRIRYETSFTMRGATRVTLQLQQILRLPRKVTLMIVAPHISNVIYNARSNTGFHPTSPNTAPAMKFWVQDVSGKSLNCFRQYKDDSRIIRAWSDHEIVISHPPLRRPYSSHLGDAFCMEKYNISRSGYLSKFHEMLRLPRKVTLQLHQILRLPRKMNLMIDPRLTWNVIYNARSNRSHNPTSPNIAPATQNESHDWSASHMKRHLQCAEQQESASNLTKYCACHAKWISWLIRVSHETSFTMRGATRVSLKPHQILRLPRDSEFKLSAENPGKMHPTLLNASILYASLLDTSIFYASILYASILHASVLYASILSRHLFSIGIYLSTHLFSTHLFSLRIYCLFASILYASILYASILSTPLFSPRLYSLHASILWASIVSWHLFSLGIYSLSACILSWHLFSLGISSLLASVLSWHLFSLGIYAPLASILSWHLFSLGIYSLLASILSWGIYSLLASILSWHLFSLGIYSLLSSIHSWHLLSLGIYSLSASILSWHLFSLGIYSLLASILSRHLFSLGIYSLLASILSWHLFSLGIYSLSASILSWHLFSLGIYSLLASILSWHLFSKHFLNFVARKFLIQTSFDKYIHIYIYMCMLPLTSLPPGGLGGVVINMSGEQLSFLSTEVEKKVLNAMVSKGQRTIIQELEMMAVLGALRSWQDEISRHRVVQFTDSQAVRGSFPKSWSIVWWTWFLALKQGLFDLPSWIERVPSQSNLADVLSREAVTALGSAKRVEVDPWEMWCLVAE